MKTLAITILAVALSGAGCAQGQDPIESATMQGLCGNTGNHTCCPGSPIVIDIAGDGIALTSAEDGVTWTLHPGETGRWAWTAPGSDDAWLAMDRNGNGAIDDGGELFGDQTLQYKSDSPNGFLALAYYDAPDQGGNGDGVIDSSDAIWPSLRLWRDADHDAVSTPVELLSLASAGIHAFNLAAVASSYVDMYGNEFRYMSTIVADAPVGPVASDVWLRQASLDAPQAVTTYSCTGWEYLVRRKATASDPDVMCTNGFTTLDPIATNGAGNPSRLIKRTATGYSSLSAAEGRVNNLLSSPIDGDDDSNSCEPSDFPIPDPVWPPPYLQGKEFGMRMTCSSQTTDPHPPSCLMAE